MAVAQVVFSAVILFVLYRYLLVTIGVEQIGVWSIVLATTSVSCIGELGLSGSVVKFVAKYIARGDMDNASGVIQTATISIGVLIGGVLIIAYPLLVWILERIVPAPGLKDALSILPYALTSLWVAAIARAFQSGLDGCQRIDLRGLIMIVGSVCNLLFVLVLVPDYGLLGLAYGKIIQAGTVLLISWILLRRELSNLPIIPHCWHQTLFSEMIRYGINFQIISIMVMLTDPVTKALMSRFGGLSILGYYEMANRLIVQFRALLVSANQVLVPVISGLQETMQERIQSVYKDSYRLLTYLALPLYAGFMGAIPIISEVWIGHHETVFVVFAMVLTAATFFNILIGPAYFSNLGTGRMCWNAISHITIGVLNGGLGFMLGIFYGSIGVVIAWAVALFVGSSIVIFAYHAKHHIPLRELLPGENFWLALASGAGLTLNLFIYYRFNTWMSISMLGTICVLAFIAIILLPTWFHPMRTRMMGWFARGLL